MTRPRSILGALIAATAFVLAVSPTGVEAETIILGDETLADGSQDGWSSNLHVLQNEFDIPGPGGEIYSYTNTSGGQQLVTPVSWNYFITAVRGRVTPFLVKVLDPDGFLENPDSMEVVAIGTTRLAFDDYDAEGEFSDDFYADAPTSFTLDDGETIAIGVIDADPDGTNNEGSVIPFDGANSGDNNHWYGGNGAANTYNPAGTTPLQLGHTFGGTEAADINRNYQFNITLDVEAALDTDGDGMPDSYEDLFDVLDKNVNDANQDPDSDDSTNLAEYQRGTLPDKADTDEDGLRDGYETGNGFWDGPTETGTDPLDPDTDDDGLLDGVETNTGDFVDAMNTGTDPFVADTDGDLFSDSLEVMEGTDPTDPLSNPSILDTAIGADPLVASTNVDGWRSCLVVLEGSGYFNNTANPKEVYVGDFNFTVGNVRSRVTPFIVLLNDFDGDDDPFNDNDFTILNIGRTRVANVDYTALGVTGFPFTDGGTSIRVEPGERIAPAFIDANPDGRGGEEGSVIPFAGNVTAGEMWFNGQSGVPHPEPPAPLEVDLNMFGVPSAGVENRNYLFNLDVKIADYADTDNDGLPDLYEDNNEALDKNVNDAGLDPDEDNLTNLGEFQQGTDPGKPDTDGDGLLDGYETNTGMWVGPQNTGTNPRNSDTDGDGLPDGVETNTGVLVDAMNTGSNPFVVDSDSDSYPDGIEVANGSDPNNPNSVPAIPIITIIDGLLGNDLTDPEDDADDTLPADDFDKPYIIPGLDVVNLFTSDTADEGFSPGDGFGGNEKTYDIFDNKVGGGEAKWCCNGAPLTVTVEFENPVILTHFTITSGNDTPAREPLDWQILGSNDFDGFDGTFVPIFTQSADTSLWGGVINQTARIDLPPSSAAYKFIRYEVTRTGGANHQINEIEYFGVVGSGAPFLITDITYDDTTNEFTVTWNSIADHTYGLFFSNDLSNFDADVSDSIPSQGDTTTFTFDHPLPGAEALYFRVVDFD